MHLCVCMRERECMGVWGGGDNNDWAFPVLLFSIFLKLFFFITASSFKTHLGLII